MALEKENKIHPGKGIRINYKGNFDMDSLYKDIKSWYGSHNYDYYEKDMTEKIKPHGNSLQLKMIGEREVDDFVKFEINVEFNEVLRLKKVNKGYSGDARIMVRATMILDHANNWKNIPFLFYLYNNFILKKKILNYYWPRIYNEMMDMNSVIKSSLGLIK